MPGQPLEPALSNLPYSQGQARVERCCFFSSDSFTSPSSLHSHSLPLQSSPPTVFLCSSSPPVVVLCLSPSISAIDQAMLTKGKLGAVAAMEALAVHLFLCCKVGCVRPRSRRPHQWRGIATEAAPATGSATGVLAHGVRTTCRSTHHSPCTRRSSGTHVVRGRRAGQALASPPLPRTCCSSTTRLLQVRALMLLASCAGKRRMLCYYCCHSHHEEHNQS